MTAGTNTGANAGAGSGAAGGSGTADAASGSSGTSSGSVGGIPGGQEGAGTTIAGCMIFPNDNPWNVAIDGPGVQVTHTYDAQLVPDRALHPDFGDWTTDHYGIPFNVVDAGQPDTPMTFSLYADESDPGPGGWIGANPAATGDSTGMTAYPFFLGMHIEGDPATGGAPGDLPGDQHGIVLQQGASGCVSYEAWNCVVPTTASFDCANGAKFDLTSDALRTPGWTSGDLAGLSILAGIVRIAEVQAGTVTHAIRVTFNNTQSGYIPPATHAVSPGSGAGPLGSAYPPMGLRLRLKASVDTSGYSMPSQVIMAAMKKYGLIVADIGSDWYFQGDSDDGWAAMAPDGQDTYIDEIVGDFGKLKGSDFEAVYTGNPVSTGL
ncbi:MAG TPA: hypothetical protein VK841_13680 [Polyangiaceae bacterium]|nr:hypothetical protein [Polyangiaceae bacterium]